MTRIDRFKAAFRPQSERSQRAAEQTGTQKTDRAQTTPGANRTRTQEAERDELNARMDAQPIPDKQSPQGRAVAQQVASLTPDKDRSRPIYVRCPRS
jgi:hypothetical protein